MRGPIILPAWTFVRGGARLATHALLFCLFFATPSPAQQTFDVSEQAGAVYSRCSESNRTPDETLKRCLDVLQFELPSRVAARVHIIIGWSHWAMQRDEAAAAALTEACGSRLKSRIWRSVWG
jgi:hypothetical protein